MIPLLATVAYVGVAVVNAYAIYYIRKHPLQSEMLKRFIPCFYFNVTSFALYSIFDYHNAAWILGIDPDYYFQSAIACDIWFSAVKLSIALDVLYLFFLAADLIVERCPWRQWFTSCYEATIGRILTRNAQPTSGPIDSRPSWISFKYAYGAVLCLILTTMLIRHFTIDTYQRWGCYKWDADAPLFYDAVTVMEISAFVATLISLIVLVQLNKEERLFRFVLLVATAAEIPEALITTLVPHDHPINSPTGMYFRYLLHSAWQLVFVVIFALVARDFKQQKKEEMQFENPAGEHIYNWKSNRFLPWTNFEAMESDKDKTSSFFRSADMSLCQLFLHPDAAYHCIAALGETGSVQFREQNQGASVSQRRFLRELKRCDEMDRKLRYIEHEIVTDDVEILYTDDIFHTPQPGRQINDLEAVIDRFEEELVTINNTTKSLADSNIHLWELAQVVEKVRLILDDDHEADPGVEDTFEIVDEAEALINDDDTISYLGSAAGTELKQVAGIIRRDRLFAFERLLFRMCNGAVYMQKLDCDEDHPLFGKEEQSVFVLFFSGERMATKVDWICRGSPARIYAFPADATARQALYKQKRDELSVLNEVIDRTFDYRQRVIAGAARSIDEWRIKVLKMTMVYHALDYYTSVVRSSEDDIVAKNSLVAECWIPSADLETVRDALRAGAVAAGSSIQPILDEIGSDELPPTHFTTNKYTRGFQNIVNAYGIADYKELNPAPFTIISFPFLFAVMFGDVGHGIIMLLCALALIMYEKTLIAKRIRGEIFTILFGGRYIVLLMSVFSLYTGFIYNEFYGRSANIFGSSWATSANNNSCWNWKGLSDVDKWEREAAAKNRTFEIMLDPIYCYDNDVGFFKFHFLMLDPVWDIASNRLTYLNTMKMKCAVILGVLQMMFGLCLSLGNHLHRRSLADIYLNFLPQLVFLTSIFGYLCVQIIAKWVLFPAGPATILGRFYPGSNCAPSLLIGLINMFMFTSRKDGFGTYNHTGNFSMLNSDDDNSGEFIADEHCATAFWYPGESIVEKVLIAIAFLTVPVLLLGKPLIMWRKFRRNRHLLVNEEAGGRAAEEHSFFDIMIYKAIHTIEFVLGCISHTASYLRLWALSLAHSVLSDILWTKVLGHGTSVQGWFGAPAQFVFFLIFGAFTVVLLVIMEALSAFLHALRLHWVEFQSKFYSGNGVKFEPFSFEERMRNAE